MLSLLSIPISTLRNSRVHAATTFLGKGALQRHPSRRDLGAEYIRTEASERIGTDVGCSSDRNW
jgi:hypothetical protein